MGHEHHHHFDHSNETRLRWALLLTASFLIIEAVAGLLTHSLSLLSDAAHMFTDTAALAIALAATRLTRKPADEKRTFGYYRFEILAAAFNAILLFFVAVYIVYEAVQRIFLPVQINTSGMALVAIAGLLVNVISFKILSGGQAENMNVRGAYLEALADMLGSAGVVVGAVLMWFTHWQWIDSVIAVGIGLWVLPRTWLLLRDSLHILLEGVPDGVDIKKIRAALEAIDGVANVHDLHVWSLTNQKISLTAHLVCPQGHTQKVLDEAMLLLANQFEIYHVTLQCELFDCALIRPENEHFAPVHEHHK